MIILSAYESLYVVMVEPAIKYDAILVSRESLCDDAVGISLDVAPEIQEKFQFSAGQYLAFDVNMAQNSKIMQRTYTLCSKPGVFPLKFAVRQIKEGSFSHYLANLQLGERLKISTPMGRFYYEHDANCKNNYLLVAGGVGITPIFSIIQEILFRSEQAQVTLLYGNRESESIIFRDALADLKDQFIGRFRLIHFLSRQNQDVALLSGRLDLKRWHDLIATGLIVPKQYDQAFICAPAGMMEDAVVALKSAGLERKLIKTERFVSKEILHERAEKMSQPALGGVEVRLLLDGIQHKITMLYPQQTILAVAQENKLQLPFSCAAGMCATCRAKLVSGQIEMKTNYSLEDWELEAGFVLTCQAMPRSEKIVIDFDAV